MRHRGLRWLLRHGHLDDDAVHVLDTPDHAGGWSVDASVTVPGWDRQGLERPAVLPARSPPHRAVVGPVRRLWDRIGRQGAEIKLEYRYRGFSVVEFGGEDGGIGAWESELCSWIYCTLGFAGLEIDPETHQITSGHFAILSARPFSPLANDHALSDPGIGILSPGRRGANVARSAVVPSA